MANLYWILTHFSTELGIFFLSFPPFSIVIDLATIIHENKAKVTLFPMDASERGNNLIVDIQLQALVLVSRLSLGLKP